MIALPASSAQSAPLVFWQKEYVRHLEQRLERSLAYLRETPAAELRLHARSFLELLGQTHHYPALTKRTLEFIAALHPLPMRWELTYAWEPELRFALDHTLQRNISQRAEYRCALGDVLLVNGRFEEAVEQCREVMRAGKAPETLRARASRIAFLSLRYMGRSDEAARVLADSRLQFPVDSPASEVPPELAGAWLVYNQSCLEVLRDQGRLEAAQTLADEMLALDRRLGSPDRIQTADLLTKRSTLLWSRSQYQAAIDDLNDCIRFYREAGDALNAKSRQSNLGLVYWLMGSLEPAAANLEAAISLYRKIRLDQMFTYATGNLGLVRFSGGDLAEADRLLREQVASAEQLNYQAEYNRGLWNLAFVHFFQGNFSEIKSVYDSTLEYYTRRGNNEILYLHVGWLALYYGKVGERDKALELAREAVEAGRAHNSLLLEQISLRCLASLLPEEEREAPLLRSLQLATDCGRRLEEAATWLMLAGAGDDPQRRRLAWQTGLELLRECGAERWLEGRTIDDPPFLPPFI